MGDTKDGFGFQAIAERAIDPDMRQPDAGDGKLRWKCPESLVRETRLETRQDGG